MGKRDELIAKYADELQNKCNIRPDVDLLKKVTIGWGPAIYNADAPTVAASQPSKLETIKYNFLIKKLGLCEGPELMDYINSVIETYGDLNAINMALLYVMYWLRNSVKKQSTSNVSNPYSRLFQKPKNMGF